MNQQHKHKKQHFLTFGVYVFIFLFAGNLIATYVMHFYVMGTTCMTTAQVASDSRCLYILSGQVYEKGTRSSPHQAHPCGTDVTAVVPASHINNKASYLLPTYVANICAAVTPTPSPKPTATPTPKLTNTPTPTVKPVLTSTPIPTTKPNATATPVPTSSNAASHPTSTPTPTQSVAFTATPTHSGNATTPTVTTTLVISTPTPSPSSEPSVTPTIDPTLPLLNLSLSLVGVDTPNATPLHIQKGITLLVYNSGDDISTSSVQPLQTVPGTVSFDKTSATFTNATFPLPNVSQGQYQFVALIPGYLKTLIASGSATVFPVSSGTATQLPETKMLAGDIDGNNVIDIADYNGLLRCYGLHVENPSPTCPTPQPADLNDDGVIDASDYNIFLYNLYAYKKQTNTLPTPTFTPTPTLTPTATPVPTFTTTPAPTVKPSVTAAAQLSITPTPNQKNRSIVATLVAGVSDNSAVLTKIFDIIIFLILCATVVFGFIKSSLFAKLMKKSPPTSKPSAPSSTPISSQKPQETTTQSQGVVK